MRILLTIASAHAAAPELPAFDISVIADVRYTYLLEEGVYDPVLKELTDEFKLFTKTDDEVPLLTALDTACGQEASVKAMLQCMGRNVPVLTDKAALGIMPFYELVEDARKAGQKGQISEIKYKMWLSESVKKAQELVCGNQQQQPRFDGICSDDDCTDVVGSLKMSFPALKVWFDKYSTAALPHRPRLLVSVLLVFAVLLPYHAYADETDLYSQYTRKLREGWAPDVDFSKKENMDNPNYEANVFKPKETDAPAENLGELITRTRVKVFSKYKGGEMKFSQFVVRAAAITRKCLSKSGTMFAQGVESAVDLLRGMTLPAAESNEKFPAVKSAKLEYACHGTSFTTSREVANRFAEAEHGRHSIRMVTRLETKKSLAVSFHCLQPFGSAEDEIFVMPGATALAFQYDHSNFHTSVEDDAKMNEHKAIVKVASAAGPPPPGPGDDAAHRTDHLTVLQESQPQPVMARFLERLDRPGEMGAGRIITNDFMRQRVKSLVGQ